MPGSIISVFGLSMMVGKIQSSLIVQYFKLNPILLSTAYIGLQGVACISFTLCSSYAQFAFVMVVYGLTLASIDLLLPLILIELFGQEKLKDAYGIVMIGKMVCDFWGTPIGGEIIDRSGKYNLVFYESGGLYLLGSFVNYLVYFFHKRVV